MTESPKVEGWELPWHAKSMVFLKGRVFCGPRNSAFLPLMIGSSIILPFINVITWLPLYSDVN